MRIAQVSDTHLSRRFGYFFLNWEVVVDELNADPPDLVVVSGDVSFNGADDEDDLRFAAEQLRRIHAPWVVIPGNHDIGDHPMSKKLAQPVTEERIDRWFEIFGADRFTQEKDGWQIVGFTTALLGSDGRREPEHWSWLESQLTPNEHRPVLLFMHKPLYTREPHETAFNKSAIDPNSRERLWTMLRGSPVKAVASGHVHVYKRVGAHGIEFVWCPATSFVVTWDGKDVYDGVRRAGYLEFDLSPPTPSDPAPIAHRLVEPAQMVNYDLRNWFREHGSTVHLPPRPLS
jgi:3',5'-cyclic AMP phosphodiesterase CpdA